MDIDDDGDDDDDDEDDELGGKLKYMDDDDEINEEELKFSDEVRIFNQFFYRENLFLLSFKPLFFFL